VHLKLFRGRGAGQKYVYGNVPPEQVNWASVIAASVKSGGGGDQGRVGSAFINVRGDIRG